jgi:hypothetical protein
LGNEPQPEVIALEDGDIDTKEKEDLQPENTTNQEVQDLKEEESKNSEEAAPDVESAHEDPEQKELEQ